MSGFTQNIGSANPREKKNDQDKQYDYEMYLASLAYHRYILRMKNEC